MLQARRNSKWEELEDVDSFVYLGAKVSTAGGADDDINSRLCKARAVFG